MGATGPQGPQGAVGADGASGIVSITNFQSAIKFGPLVQPNIPFGRFPFFWAGPTRQVTIGPWQKITATLSSSLFSTYTGNYLALTPPMAVKVNICTEPVHGVGLTPLDPAQNPELGNDNASGAEVYLTAPFAREQFTVTGSSFFLAPNTYNIGLCINASQTSLSNTINPPYTSFQTKPSPISGWVMVSNYSL